MLLGICANGYRTLSYEYALENSVLCTYDAQGQLIFQHTRGYGRPLLQACGFEADGTLGRVTIGEDAARDCSYCLLATDDEGEDGAGSAYPSYPAPGSRRCESSDLE